MGILGMPNEILVQILQSLPRNSLRNVSLSFKLFHEIGEPILYSTLVQRGKTAIPLLIRTILDNPQLGRHFKSLDLLDIRKAFIGRQLDEDVLTQDYHDRIRAQIGQYVSGGDYKDFFRYLRDDLGAEQTTQDWCTSMFERKLNYESTTSFLMLLLPNLEKLSLEKYEICHETILSVLSAARKIQRSEKSTNRLGSLSKLRVVNLSISDYGSLVPAKVMIRILEIPSLQEFSCSGVQESSTFSFKNEPTTRHLTLLKSQVRLSYLELILPKFKHLQNFTIELSELWGSPLYGDNVFPTVIRCISQSQNTLERLTLINTKHRGRVTGEVFPPLAKFVKLHVMEIEGDFLNHPGFTFACLPPALVNLILLNSDKEKILQHFALNLNTLIVVPRLASVDVHIRRYVRDWKDEDNSNLLMEGFRSRGVTLRVGPVPSS